MAPRRLVCPGLLGYSRDVDRESGSNPPAAGPAASPPPAGPPPRRPAPGSRPAAGGISADPRLTVWIRRAIFVLVVGVAISIWVGWRWGLTAAAAVAILDMIYQSKAMAPIPAEVGATAAQRKTRRRLAALRRSGYVALNGRAIPDSDEVIDHLVIGPAGIFSVDSEQWDKRLPVRMTSGSAKRSDSLYHGPYSQLDRLAHARWEAAQASRLISAELGEPVGVTPAMVIYGPELHWGIVKLRGVEVFSGKRVRKFFRTENRATRGAHLAADAIHEVREAAERVLPPAR
jgi:Nuclease-related domain